MVYFSLLRLQKVKTKEEADELKGKYVVENAKLLRLGLRKETITEETSILLDNSWIRVEVPKDEKTRVLIFWNKESEDDKPSDDKVVSCCCSQIR